VSTQKLCEVEGCNRPQGQFNTMCIYHDAQRVKLLVEERERRAAKPKKAPFVPRIVYDCQDDG
jgi:hypothetical protein